MSPVSVPNEVGAASPAITTPGTGPDAGALLRLAERCLADQFDPAHPLTQAAQHVVGCARELVEVLPRKDLDAAQEALGCARAAVGAATYAIRMVDRDRRR